MNNFAWTSFLFESNKKPKNIYIYITNINLNMPANDNSSLEETLYELGRDIEGSNNLGKGLSEEEEKEEYKSRIEKVLKKDPLAEKVASGKESYSKIIEGVKEKYSSFWKRIRPKIDKSFDKNLREVINSIKGIVNLSLYTKYGYRYITTEEVVNKNKELMKSGIFAVVAGFGAGGAMVGIAGIVNYYVVKAGDIFDGFKMGLGTAVGFGVLFSPLLYISHLISRNDKLKRNIAILEKSAKHADEYLKDIYAEYIS